MNYLTYIFSCLMGFLDFHFDVIARQRETKRVGERETETETERAKERQRKTKRDKERQRETEREITHISLTTLIS